MKDDLENDLREIFSIPRTGRWQNDDSGSVENVDTISKVTFDERVSELQDNVDADGTPLLAKKTEIQVEGRTKEGPGTEELLKSSIMPKDNGLDAVFEESDGSEEEEEGLQNADEIVKKEAEEEPQNIDEKEDEKDSEIVKKEVVISDINNIETEEKESSKEPSKEVDNSTLVATNSEIKWLLKSPSSRFVGFYDEKNAMLSQIMIDGEIPFNRWFKELKESTVDITTMQLYDLPEIQDKMREIQQIRDRIQEIAIQCNAQYFLWERSVQLFHGVLVRAEPDVKPAAAREGLIYEHMRDMETYFYKLKGLHKSIDFVMKTLESAHECLSRQVTIALGNRDNDDRYAKKDEGRSRGGVGEGESKSGGRKLSNTEQGDLEGFDELPLGAESKPVEKKTGLLDSWGDIR